jgi:hypothetical protein
MAVQYNGRRIVFRRSGNQSGSLEPGSIHHSECHDCLQEPGNIGVMLPNNSFKPKPLRGSA